MTAFHFAGKYLDTYRKNKNGNDEVLNKKAERKKLKHDTCILQCIRNKIKFSFVSINYS